MTRAAPLIAVAAALATLAACNRDRPAEPTAAPSAKAAADSAAPTAYEADTPYAEVELSLPDEIRTEPALHRALYDEEMRTLRQFAEGAQSDRTEAGAPSDLPPYSKTITVTTALETPQLLSLKREDSDYSGGAHPNTLTSGILWDRQQDKRLTPRDLFGAQADLSGLDRALCTAVNAAKRERAPDSPALTLTARPDELWKCPRAGDVPFVLAPAVEAGKAGGLTFLIDPYIVGPYVEGPYEVDVPLAAFRSLLTPAYAGQFGGQLRD